MASFSQFGNDLFTGRRQINFIGRRRTWFTLTAVLLVIAAVGIFGRQLNFSLEFTGGSEVTVSGVSHMQNFDQRAREAVRSATGTDDNLIVTQVGDDQVRIQSEKLGSGTAASTTKVSEALAKKFDVPVKSVSASFIGPSWGATVTHKAIVALIVFLLLVSLVLSIYFRTWKMSLAALTALLHDLFFTVGVYALTGFQISPASMIGFLTILGYSLYDTVVVFDKVKENTEEAMKTGQRSYLQAANYGVNQTLVRSINTSVVALLPIAAILVVGITMLGPGTLLDLSLALFVGIAVGTYSSIFIATPLLASLRKNEPAMKELEKRAMAFQANQSSILAESGTVAHSPGEASSGVVEPERAQAAASAHASRVHKREIHPLARRDGE